MFSLGCLLFEIVCGEMAFAADNTYDALNRIMNKEYPRPESIRPELPDIVIQVIDGLLAHESNERISNCSTVIELLYGDDERLRNTSEDTQEVARDAIVQLGQTANRIVQEHQTGQPVPRMHLPGVVGAPWTAHLTRPPITQWAERVWIGIIAFMSGLLGVIVGLYAASWLGIL
jgi:hypothetical protein